MSLIIVTGAGQGIGQEIAWRFLRRGDEVAVLDIVALSWSDRLSSADRARLHSYVCDVSSPDDVSRTFHSLTHDFPPGSVLINNAGIYPRSALGEMTVKEWEQLVGINLTGAWLCSKSFAEQNGSQEVRSIVNLSSSIAFQGAPRGTHYAASKAGVLGLTRALATELAPCVRVNAVVPGVTDTAQVRAGGRDRADLIAYADASVPLKRLCEPEDVAAAAEFLSSDSASYITGQTLFVDGGSYFH